VIFSHGKHGISQKLLSIPCISVPSVAKILPELLILVKNKMIASVKKDSMFPALGSGMPSPGSKSGKMHSGSTKKRSKSPSLSYNCPSTGRKSPCKNSKSRSFLKKSSPQNRYDPARVPR